jgi:hypothetical protein
MVHNQQHDIMTLSQCTSISILSLCTNNKPDLWSQKKIIALLFNYLNMVPEANGLNWFRIHPNMGYSITTVETLGAATRTVRQVLKYSTDILKQHIWKQYLIPDLHHS